MPLAFLVSGLVLFLAIHSLRHIGDLRGRLIASVGENAYRGLYSLASVLGLALMVHGFGSYRAAGYIPVWEAPRWAAHLVIPLMTVAMILMAATYLPGRIKAMAKHPMLLSVKIWAASHLIANGDLGSMLVFGGFLAWAVGLRIALKAETPRGLPLPAFGGNDWAAIGIGAAITLVFVFKLHLWLIGVPVLATLL